MGKKSLYYLISRDRKSNDFQVIPIGNKLGNSLEEIDLYTINFSNASELMKALRSRDILEERDIDLFIVSQKEKNGEKKLKFLDLLFKDSYQIREVALASSKNRIEESSKKINDIFNHFCWKMKFQPMFYNMVVYGDTKLYQKFIKYFANHKYEDFYYAKYRDGGWIQKSYPLIRNIVDSFHQYDYSFGQNEHFALDYVYRELLENSLIEITSTDYNHNQKTIFDLSDQILTSDEKRRYAMNVFQSLPKEVFYQKGNNVVFNDELFGSYEDNDLERLSSLLGNNLPLYIQLLSFHTYYYKKGLKEARDVSEQDRQINDNLFHIYTILEESPDILESAYQWSLLYEKYRNRIVGDKGGYQYIKKNS